MTAVTLNPTPLREGNSFGAPDQWEIKNTPSLWNASLEDAFRYGGELTREALSALELVGDRKYVTVDTKVHMLMPGFRPGIPGWHTDGAPRDKAGNPGAKGAPDMEMQLAMGNVAPRFHIAVTGTHAPTRFLEDPFRFELPEEPTPDLYKLMTEAIEAGIEEGGMPTFSVRPNTFYGMSWWDAHEAVPATTHGWRFLIRVTESDFIEPQTDLRQIIRLHNPVYVPSEFGW